MGVVLVRVATFHIGIGQMVGLLLAKAEWHFDGFDNWNYSGTLVLLLLVGALVAIALSKAASPEAPRQVKVPLSSDLFPDADSPDALGTRPTRKQRPRPFSKREKRTWMRREGNPLEIQVADAARTQPPITALVLNRSRGGLLLSVPHPSDRGTNLSVRPPHAPDEEAWIHVQVRYCKQKGDCWHLGCKFTQQLPWSVLLLFG
jgi:hypothetical protein